MSTLPEQFSAARKSQIETQLNYFSAFTSKAFEGAEQLIALNFNTGRAQLDKSAAAVKRVIAAKDPRDLFSLGSQSQENFDQLLAYGRALFGIATGVQVALISSASQAAPVAKIAVPKLPVPAAKAAPAVEVRTPAPAAPVAVAPVAVAPAAPVAAAPAAPVALAPAAPVAAPPAAVAPAPAPAPVVETAPVVKAAALPEPVVQPAKPAKKPVVAADPAPAPVAKAKPAAKAAPKVAGKAVASKPAAAFPSAGKQLDMLTPKTTRKR